MADIEYEPTDFDPGGPPAADDQEKRVLFTYKAGLANLLRHPEHEETLATAACQVSKLATRASLLVKLYVLDQHKTTGKVEKINRTFMLNALKVVGLQPTSGRSAKSDIRDRLTAFYNAHFALLLPENDVPPSYMHLDGVLDYTAKDLVTALETNIKQHFVEYVQSYVDAAYHKDATVALIAKLVPKKDRDAEKKALDRKLRAITKDLLTVNGEEFVSPRRWHESVREHRLVVQPGKTHYAKNLLASDLKCHPQDYLVPMLRMTVFMESREKKLRNVLPLHTSVIPMHITIDTRTVVKLFYSDEFKKEFGSTKGALEKMFVEYKDDIWALVFRTNKRLFRGTATHAFNHMVRTDGVSCCVVQKWIGPYNPLPAREKYVDELTAQERECLSGKDVVGVDPGMGNLLYFSTEDGDKRLRYTNRQRRKETKVVKYRKILEREKKSAINKVEGRTILEWEADLSKHNHKTVSVAAFKEYICAKLLMNSKISAFYEARWHRKQKLNGYFNRCRTEARLLQRVRKIFGKPEKVVIGIGDWAQRHHRKFKEPVKGKGFRETLRKGGYRVLLVNEFRTSLQCSHCKQEGATCHKFLRSTQVDGQGRRRLIHGLLLCQQCKRPWNRDRNASINLARLTQAALKGLPRPEYLRRS
ncbi:MAG TPA: zinc ribbon domain-containing protein [Limnobacter sp.]|uniref:zinc ribbon domain-containing protein n=1 Tax=Limnobacter sp. TaxID=2003368 RepID=UPI002E30994B|nr:zinc ribbon domain-containing protein [Limnobacter sp.]HEX5486026.1 zinc ribbon domain-containing protein [Limnobacter sp.]